MTIALCCSSTGIPLLNQMDIESYCNSSAMNISISGMSAVYVLRNIAHMTIAKQL